MSDLGEVFISYSWDSEEHITSILALSNRLRSDGIDCLLDQYEVSPPEGWPRWMDGKIASADLVLVVCTEVYFARVMGYEETGKGLGVKWEGNIIYQHLYNAGANNQKFIPVLMKDRDKGFIPIPLQGASYFTVDTDAGYRRLYNRLLGKPPAEKPLLGRKKPLPTRKVKTDLTAYVVSPIDIPLWNQARWRGTAFIQREENSIPMLGLAFLNKEPATEIFKGWHRRYGNWDQYDELRIAIIEGDIPHEEPGYSVHVGVEYERVIERYKRAGLEVADDHFFATISRIHRMNAPDSPHLKFFKESYKRAGEYLLIPASCKPDGSNLSYVSALGIKKRVIHFRNVANIGPNDQDAAVLLSESL
ncbi:MAG: toll/interleukin-1 receptor domain-containing protein [Candidatus Korobacteraceae bacterium]|jgi:hypothetical protein